MSDDENPWREYWEDPVSIDRDDEDTSALPFLPPLPGQDARSTVRRPVEVEQHLWPHCLESGALAIAALLVAAWVLNKFPQAVPTWAIASTGLVLAVIVAGTALQVTMSVPVAAWLLGWGLLAAGWLTAARLAGLWHPVLWFALIIPGLVLAVLGAPAIGHHRDEIRRAAGDAEKRRAERKLRKWEIMFRQLGVSARILLEREPEEGGVREVYGRVSKPGDPPGWRGIQFSQLAALAPLIAAARRLPEDAVQFSQPKGSSSADFVLHLREETGPRADVYLPAENQPRTINRPFALGVLANKRPFELLYREVTVIIIGVKGSGKTNLENVFIAQLARCIDAVIFMIDLKGGRAARPWMMPWVQGDTPRPVIDWLATTREEADLMLDALLAGGAARARSGQGWEKIIPDADTPAVILVCDETAVMTGHGIRKDGLSNFTLAQKLSQLVETYRSEAFEQLIAALRGNVDIMGTTGVKAMSEVRIGLRVTQASDGSSVFPDDPHAAQVLARIRDKGDGIAKVGADLSPKIHFYRMSPELIDNIARWAGSIRPAPEPRLAAAMGEAYEQRWTREHGATLLAEWRQSAGMPPEPAQDADDPFWSIVAQVDDPEARVDPRHAKIRELLRQRGPAGYTVGRIVAIMANDGMTTPRETITRWLGKDKERGLVHATGKPLHRWVWQGGHGPDDGPGD